MLVHQAMLQHPITDVSKLCSQTNLTNATVNTALARLEDLNIVEESTGQKRNRLFCYRNYLQLLNQQMELPE